MALLRIFINRTNGQLVRQGGLQQGYVLPPLYQGDSVGMEVSVVEDNPSAGIGATSLVNLAAYSLKVGVGGTPLGNGSVTPIALQTSWVLDTDQTKWTGALGLNTADVTTYLGSLSERQAYIEFELRETATGNYETIYGGTVTLRANLVTAGSSVALPGDTALGSAEAAATYVPKVGAAGGSIILKSPDGTKQLILYCSDDGTFHAEPIS